MKTYTVQEAAARLGIDGVTRQTVHTLLRVCRVPKEYASIGGRVRRVISEQWLAVMAKEQGGRKVGRPRKARPLRK